jgi:hypothetical protein
MKGLPGGLQVVALVASSLLLLSMVALPSAIAAPSTSSTTTTTSATSTTQSISATPVALVLSVIPPKLPADGGSYPAIVLSLQSSTKAASLALNETVVFLTSSEQGVGSVPSQVTIPAGAGFAVANFTATTTPGTTSILAHSVGLSSASAQVTTVTPSGFATHLSVIPAPGSQLLNPAAQGTVLVEALDSAGFPAKASSPIDVSLSSSNDNVVSLPATTLTLPTGSVLTSTPYDVGTAPGTDTITASASGFTPGSGVVSVQGTLPFALSVFAEPDPIATLTSGRLVVTLTDTEGTPAPAPVPITVAISSSNTSIISSDQTTTIETGQIYAVASFASGAAPGTANLTASSPGLKSDFATVTVARPTLPAKLTLLGAPNPVLANNGSYDSVVVALTDANGNPAVAPSNILVTLTSSSSIVGDIGGSLTIASGSSYAVASFTSTFFVGSTSITAIAQNLQSAMSTVSSYGPVPTQVIVQALPSTLPADGGQYSALEVMLEGASGAPAIAPTDVSVQLTSSSTDIATVNSTVVIGAGDSYVLAEVTTTISPGIANITATSPGYASSSAGFVTTRPGPSQLGFYAAPASAIQSLGQRGDAVVAVQLQDSGSAPARASQDTPVVVTSSNGSVMAKPIQLDIPAGADYAWAYVNASQPGETILTASSSGLASGNANLSVSSLPIVLTLTSSPPVVAIGSSATVQLQVDVLGSPVEGANVTLSATPGAMSALNGITDSTGQFTDTFIPAVDGVAIITALVQDPLFGNQTTGTNILVALAGAAGTGHAKGLGSTVLIMVVALVAVVVVVIGLGARRVLKRRGKDPDEDEEDEGAYPAEPADSEK